MKKCLKTTPLGSSWATLWPPKEGPSKKPLKHKPFLTGEREARRDNEHVKKSSQQNPQLHKTFLCIPCGFRPRLRRDLGHVLDKMCLRVWNTLRAHQLKIYKKCGQKSSKIYQHMVKKGTKTGPKCYPKGCLGGSKIGSCFFP